VARWEPVPRRGDALNNDTHEIGHRPPLDIDDIEGVGLGRSERKFEGAARGRRFGDVELVATDSECGMQGDEPIAAGRQRHAGEALAIGVRSGQIVAGVGDDDLRAGDRLPVGRDVDNEDWARVRGLFCFRGCVGRRLHVYQRQQQQCGERDSKPTLRWQTV
jgi:hypothetical protein